MRTMAGTLFALALVGCGGPQHNRFADTPTGQTRRTPYEAPPANGGDVDRNALIQQFNDQQDARQAHEEANRPAAQPAPPPLPRGTATPGPPGETPPKKVGPAEQAPMPPKK